MFVWKGNFFILGKVILIEMLEMDVLIIWMVVIEFNGLCEFLYDFVKCNLSVLEF